MEKLTEKQILQVHNILETLLEATEHFSKLIKKKEWNQSLLTFHSIVEGFETINKFLHAHKVTIGEKEKKKIEQYVLLIAQQLEQGNFIKISEILQFTFIPQLRKLQKALNEKYNVQFINNQITIGVYLNQLNPRKAYPEERINALVNEAERQGTNLLFFSSEDIDFKNEKISADVFINGEWQRITASFPDVIHNISFSSRFQQSITERKLRRMVPFTSFFVGNKLYLPKKLVQYRKYAELLVPFKIVSSDTSIYDFLEKNNRAVLKPILGRRGENIYFIEKKGNHYVILDHKQEYMVGNTKFNEWIHDVILRKKNSYIIQKYIEARTKDDEPFDIRAHMQKNGEGKWQITRIYPRIGHKKVS
mgnify:CR=1 FL=1